jgi:hypothetical protein
MNKIIGMQLQQKGFDMSSAAAPLESARTSAAEEQAARPQRMIRDNACPLTAGVAAAQWAAEAAAIARVLGAARSRTRFHARSMIQQPSSVKEFDAVSARFAR